MFLLSPQTKVFLAAGSTDMRKSFRSLVTLTESILEQDPLSGHLFVFVNGRRDMMKIQPVVGVKLNRISQPLERWLFLIWRPQNHIGVQPFGKIAVLDSFVAVLTTLAPSTEVDGKTSNHRSS